MVNTMTEDEIDVAREVVVLGHQGGSWWGTLNTRLLVRYARHLEARAEKAEVGQEEARAEASEWRAIAIQMEQLQGATLALFDEERIFTWEKSEEVSDGE